MSSLDRIPRSLLRGSLLATVLMVALVIVVNLLTPTRRGARDATQRTTAARGAALQVGPIAGPAAMITGKVASEDGRPIASARVCATCVSCEPTATQLMLCANAGANGDYVLAGLQPIGYRIAATAAGFSSSTAQRGNAVFLARGDTRRGVDIVLRHDGVELSGVVVDALGGTVAADVRVLRWEGVPSVVSVTSGADGRFEVFVPKGATTLVASAEGYASVSVSRLAPAKNVELVLTPSSHASGVVIDAASHRPIAGASVRALHIGYPLVSSARVALSDENGRFALDRLDPGKYMFDASSAEYRGVSSGEFAIPVAESVKDVTILVSKYPQVRGRVVIGALGAPCREGEVALGPVPPSETARAPKTLAGRSASTMVFGALTAEGEVVFDAVPPGVYFANVTCRDHTLRDGPRSVEVGQKQLDELRWRVEPGIGLSILVLDERNRPVPGAEVAIEIPLGGGGDDTADVSVMPVIADAGGRYRLPPGLEPGRYVLKPHHNYAGDPVEVKLVDGMGIVDVTVRIRGNSSLLVRVRDSKGDPVNALSVQGLLVPPAPAPAEATAPVPARALGEGQYAIGPVESGDYRVDVRDDRNPSFGVSVAGSTTINLPQGATIETTLVLARAARITGRVLDEHDAPVADAWVSVERQETESQAMYTRMMRMINAAGRVLTDRDGRFTMDQLSADASFDVLAREYDGRSASAHGVHAGSEITLRLPPPSTQVARRDPGTPGLR